MRSQVIINEVVFFINNWATHNQHQRKLLSDISKYIASMKSQGLAQYILIENIMDHDNFKRLCCHTTQKDKKGDSMSKKRKHLVVTIVTLRRAGHHNTSSGEYLLQQTRLKRMVELVLGNNINEL